MKKHRPKAINNSRGVGAFMEQIMVMWTSGNGGHRPWILLSQ